MTVAASYDAEEAKFLLAKAADKEQPNAAKREEAGKALLADLKKLSDVADFIVKPVNDISCLLIFPETNKKALLGVGPRGVFLVGPDANALAEVPLWFNRITGQLETSTEDSFYVGEPGKPKRRQSALAAVVAKALEVLR